MSQIATAKEQLALANRLVDEFTASVASGEAMDLKQFNGTIDDACKAALGLPQEDLQEVKAELVSLLERLNAAKSDLEKAQAASEEASE
jgi:multidrug resistance efflux pump